MYFLLWGKLVGVSKCTILKEEFKESYVRMSSVPSLGHNCDAASIPKKAKP